MGYKILIADDEAEIRDLLHLYLEKDGYEVIEAADGAQALSALQDAALRPLIRKIEGDTDNVVGLPVRTLEKTLKEFL